MSATARNVSSAGESAGAAARRPTRAGISAGTGITPVRRGRSRLALVSDASSTTPATASKRGRDIAAERERVEETALPVVGSLALQPEPSPEQRRQPVVSEPLRLAPPAPVTVARVPFVVLTLVLIVGGIVGLLVLNTQINKNAFELQKLREQQAQLAAREQQLSKELAAKEAPGNLAAEAARQGMVPAGTPAYITLPDGQIVGVPQPAGKSAR